MFTTTTPAAESFTFKPVRVTRGRKFRGFAYDIGEGYTYTRGYPGSGVDPYSETYHQKLWDPVQMKVVHVNCDYLEDCEVPADKLEADRKSYIDHTIQGTISWCRSQSAGKAEAEVLRFARNVLRKRHPELMSFIDKAAPDTRDVVVEVQRTFQWAMGLKTQACVMYGRFCPGGKPLSDSRKVNAARKALEKKGITKLDGFEEAWELTLTAAGLANLI